LYQEEPMECHSFMHLLDVMLSLPSVGKGKNLHGKHGMCVVR